MAAFPTSQGSGCPCSCSPQIQDGLVLLFYRYFALTPILPLQQETTLPISNDKIAELANFHVEQTTELSLRGKIRVGKEGFNVTVSGSREQIQQYMDRCIHHWSFDGLGLNDEHVVMSNLEKRRKDFFKPTRGCACAFDKIGQGGARVRICDEITPMAWSGFEICSAAKPKGVELEYIDPEEWHRMMQHLSGEPGMDVTTRPVLVDLRNHYESRIGYFADPSNMKPALRPEIRRFSQWPHFVRRRLAPELAMEQTLNASGNEREQPAPRTIMTYCTGGIRCEKGARWLAQSLAPQGHDRIMTLKGGIAAYLSWMEEEILAERRTMEESAFKGKNYVFDARGAVGLDVKGTVSEPVANCHGCGKAEDRQGKCMSNACHILLVMCEVCEGMGQRCCDDCEGLALTDKPRRICRCEREREERLWGQRSVVDKL